MKYRISSNKRQERLLEEIRYFIKKKYLKTMKNVFYLTEKAFFFQDIQIFVTIPHASFFCRSLLKF